MSRKEFFTLPVDKNTRDRVRKLKGTASYDFFIRNLLDRIDAMNDPANRVNLRREK